MGRDHKAIRLCKLFEILSGGMRYLTIREIANSLHVTERTVYRDFTSLETLGFPVMNDRGYKIFISSRLNIDQLTDCDFQTIKSIMEASSFMRLPNMRERCDSILKKLQLKVSHQDRDLAPPESYLPAERISSTTFNFNIRQLEKAIQQQKVIEMDYHALNEEKPVARRVHPYVITVRKSNWYLIGFSERNQEVHLYRLERISAVKITNQRFERVSTFDIEQYFHSVWGVFRGESALVELRLTELAVRLAHEQPWPEQTELIEQDDGSLLVKMKVQGMAEFKSWILSLSPHVEVLKPESLRKELTTTLKKMLKLHSE